MVREFSSFKIAEGDCNPDEYLKVNKMMTVGEQIDYLNRFSREIKDDIPGETPEKKIQFIQDALKGAYNNLKQN